MRRLSYRPYAMLMIFFACLFGLPKGASERMRSMVVCSFSPGWRVCNFLREQTIYVLTLPFSSKASTPSQSQEWARLVQENYLLHSQMESVREWLLNEERLQKQAQFYQTLRGKTQGADLFKRRSEQLCEELKLQLSSVPAKIVFREPASWSSCVWINAGQRHNRKLQKQVICKNSPVVLGSCVVGIVEYVGELQSRVRLITDSSLAISVRAVRGEQQNHLLSEKVDALLFSLQARADLVGAEAEREQLVRLLSQMKQRLSMPSGDLYLAKGELRGNGAPLWRARDSQLKGVGFNYDFADEEGPARDLRSGEPYGSSRPTQGMHLLQQGDLLITTGLDGLFPKGLQVASVSSVHLLKEGASSYEIQARAAVEDLEELSYVFVLPPYSS